MKKQDSIRSQPFACTHAIGKSVADANVKSIGRRNEGVWWSDNGTAGYKEIKSSDLDRSPCRPSTSHRDINNH